MPKVTFLGTNGWYDTLMGNTVSVLVETNDYYVILDAGNGFSKIGQIIINDKPTYLFLSHFHLDHIIGLHTLSLNKFPKGLTIIIQEGNAEILNNFVKPPLTVPFEKLTYPVNIMEVPKDSDKLPFKAAFLPMQHPVPTLGIRFEVENRVIAYTADTAYCENAITLAKKCDLLIAESAFKPGEKYPNSPHINPEEAAQIATEAGAKKLLLTHFEARRYPDLDSRKAAEASAQEIFKESYYATDGMEIQV